ncbi:sialidase family protein [Maribellus comscasis]|uniref:sialidase family protein n=1 Tax=Maribellus comscasis TaxID=2681766 RepID=UPI00131D0381|nr:sialidase family protein [Maribellus comscasis]
MKTKQISLLLLISCIFFLANSCQSKKNKRKEYINNNPQKIIVWNPTEENVEMYRIPGIIVSTKGTVLAFAEERPIAGDEDPKSLVLRRSADNGKTWSKNIYIEKCDGNYWSAHANEIAPIDDRNKKEVWTNVAPIVDKETGRIFFFYSLSEGAVAEQNLQRYTKVFYKYSDDDGLTWSERTEVTDLLNAKEDGSPNKDENGNWITDVNGYPCDYLGRAFHMPGPGHGIQLTGGRLLLQLWNRTALGKIDEGSIPIEERQYGICTIYSDDHGKTWHYGSAFGHDGLNMNESRIAELENGDVYINSRYVSVTSGQTDNRRITGISHDKGATWTNIKIDSNFPLTNPCDGGLVAIPSENTDKKILLYSKNEIPGKREKLVIRLSHDEGESWPVSKVADEGPAWYSDLTLLPDNTILVIYEAGINKPVYCINFNLEWITSQ